MNTVIYPVIFESDKDGYLVTVPDLGQQTQGKNLADAEFMARDLISLWVMDLEDRKEPVPQPNSVKFNLPKGAIVLHVKANITTYRKKYGYK